MEKSLEDTPFQKARRKTFEFLSSDRDCSDFARKVHSSLLNLMNQDEKVLKSRDLIKNFNTPNKQDLLRLIQDDIMPREV